MWILWLFLFLTEPSFWIKILRILKIIWINHVHKIEDIHHSTFLNKKVFYLMIIDSHARYNKVSRTIHS